MAWHRRDPRPGRRRAAVVAVAQDHAAGTEHDQRVAEPGHAEGQGREVDEQADGPLGDAVDDCADAEPVGEQHGAGVVDGEAVRSEQPGRREHPLAAGRLLGDAAVDEVRHEDAVVGADRDVVDAQRDLGEDVPDAGGEVDGDDPPGAASETTSRPGSRT